MYSGKKAQHDFPKMRGGGSKAVWNFSKNSSVLEEPPFPYGANKFSSSASSARHLILGLVGISVSDQFPSGILFMKILYNSTSPENVHKILMQLRGKSWVERLNERKKLFVVCSDRKLRPMTDL